MNLTITPGDPESAERFADSRHAYLDGLGHAQELLIEVLIHGAEHRWIRTRDGETCGHVIVHDRTRLIEFYLQRDYWVFGETVLEQLVEKLGLAQAWVKTFDSLLLSSALRLQQSIETLGLLVRDFVPRQLPPSRAPAYRCRIGGIADIDAILAVDQDVFTMPERVRGALERGWIRIFEQGERVVGFGILRPVVAGRSDVDVGIAIDRPFRGRGYATYVFADLVQECLRQGWNPVCGCAKGNRASRHLGERVGMVSRHRLLAVTF